MASGGDESSDDRVVLCPEIIYGGCDKIFFEKG
jgi:hypothetical protein